MHQIRDSLAAAPAAPRVTAHGRARMQQRGIRSDALEALLDFGSARHLHSKGRQLVFFDKKARSRLENADTAAAREADRLRSTYAIVGSDGTVVTVGHHFRRVRKP
jgi:hypothetical protein